MAEYARVQEENLDRILEGMTEIDKKAYLGILRSNYPDDKRSLRELLRDLGEISRGVAGHQKSALFARLLAGKPALPNPPPTSFGYPWYSVIEDEGPFQVSIKGMTLPFDDRKGIITINQCPWLLGSLNNAARQLLESQKILDETSTREEPESLNKRFIWTQQLLEQVLKAYANSPEFIVQYEQWGRYRLRTGTRESECRRDYAETWIEEVANRKTDRLLNLGNVLNSQRLFINGSIGETISKVDNPLVAIENANTRLAKQEGTKAFDRVIGFDQLVIDQCLGNLESEVARFGANQPGADIVRLTFWDWELEKIR